jgi:ribosomal protein L37E
MNNDQWNPFLKPSQSLKDEDFEAVSCKQCGNAAFDQYYRLYKLSALKSPNGKQQIYNVPIFVCANCGYILDPRKDEISTENTSETENK